MVDTADMPLLVSDEMKRNKWPVHVFQNKTHIHKCHVCDTFAAKWAAHGDALSGEKNPCLYCTLCYNMFHRSSEGRLLRDHQRHAVARGRGKEVGPWQHDPRRHGPEPRPVARESTGKRKRKRGCWVVVVVFAVLRR